MTMELDITFCFILRYELPNHGDQSLGIKVEEDENCVHYWEVLFFVKLGAQHQLGSRW